MEEIEAVCVKLVHEKKHAHRHGMRGSESNTPVYYPVFEYSYDGTTYTERDAFHTATNRGLPKVDAACKIRIDPEHPEKPYYVNRVSNLIQVITGVVLIVGGLVVIILYNR